MKKGKSVFSWVTMMASMVIVFGFCLEAQGVKETAKTGKSRPDIVEIKTLSAFGDLEAAPVPFLHDKHTDALKNDCKSCHLTDAQTNPVTGEKRLSTAYMRPDGELTGTKAELKSTYHNNCFGCHEAKAAAGEKTGPQDGECRACHQEKPEYVSNWTSIGFDKSLHYRHIANKDIKPLDPAEKDNCSRCHEVYDEATGKLVYKKGEEVSWRTSAPAVPTADGPSFAEVSHIQCVTCHLELKDAKETGPIQCAGCHSALEQKRIKVVADVPRLERGQPDLTLITATLDKPEDGTRQTFLPPVAFNHKLHETQADNCRVCHHKDMQSCNKCHTVGGSKEGDFVTLEQAMHQVTSQASCVGCHAERTQAKECAGCHAAMTAKPTSDKYCSTCHQKVELPGLEGMMAMAAKGVEMDKEQKAAAAAMLVEARPEAPKAYTVDEVPEEVVIGVLSDKYEPSKFPHKKIVDSLLKGMKDSELAAVFHGDKYTMCSGCHHNSPAQSKPPRCASCHAKPFNPDQPMRPGLKGAYHGQCISCHQEMGLEKPAATDCVACHKKRN